MRYLAVARYRMLTSIRSANWVFGTSVAVVLFVCSVDLTLIGGGSILTPENLYRQHADFNLSIAAALALINFLLHAAVLVSACMLFGANRRKTDTALTADLMDTAPLTPSERFWGDAMGIFASAMIVHLCTLPLLVMWIVLSPLGMTAFLCFELLIVAVVFLASAAASWKLRAASSRWAHTRVVRNAALFFIGLLVIVISNTHWEDFRDAFPSCLREPSARSWSALMSAIDSPPLLFTWLFLLYAGFMTFYYLQGVRTHAQR